MTEFNGSAKDYAASLGLAKAGKGRMSLAARDAVEKARKGGVTFSKESAAPVVKRVKAEKPVRVRASSPQAEPKAADTKVNPAAVRVWAKENGIEVAARGRVHSDVIAAYKAAVPEAEQETDRDKMSEYRDGAPRVYPEGTKFEGEVNGKSVITSLNNGKVACMNSGYSVAYCGEQTHKVLLSSASEPVTVSVKR